MIKGASFNDCVDRILEDDTRYDRNAYVFLRDALETTVKSKKSGRSVPGSHVSAAELLEGFRKHTLSEFGPMGVTVLEYWGVHSCEDVGHMVFNLVGAGVFGKTDDDSLDAFRAGYDFHDAFVRPFRADAAYLRREPISR